MRKKEINWKNVFFIVLILLSFSFSVAQSSFPSKVIVNGLNILYSKFDGATTNFNLYNESQLGNLSNMILEISQYGRIDFLEPMNVVGMAINWTVNFNKYVNISSNLINVYNPGLPGINKSANLTLKGLTFNHPVIYHNAVICTDCNEINYSNGNLIFNVSSFNGVYYAKENQTLPYCGDGICNNGETSTTCPADCPSSPTTGGGAAGGGGATTNNTNQTTPAVPGADFYVTPTLSEIKMQSGTYFEKMIKVTNNGTVNLSIDLGVSGIGSYAFPAVKAISLAPGDSKEVRFDVYVPKDTPSNVYLGMLLFKGGGILRNSKVILQVTQNNALFDMRTIVLNKYVSPGGRVRANITVINKGELRNFDVNLRYEVLDFNNTNYTFKKEQFAINTSHQGVYFMDLPQKMNVGNYVFYSVVNYKNVNATSYDTFVVENVSYFSWIILIIIVLVLMWLTYRWYLKRKGKLYNQYVKGLKPVQRRIKLSDSGKTTTKKKSDEDEGGVPELP